MFEQLETFNKREHVEGQTLWKAVRGRGRPVLEIDLGDA